MIMGFSDTIFIVGSLQGVDQVVSQLALGTYIPEIMCLWGEISAKFMAFFYLLGERPNYSSLDLFYCTVWSVTHTDLDV